jgi:phosphate transport system substrate-binding protein
MRYIQKSILLSFIQFPMFLLFLLISILPKRNYGSVEMWVVVIVVSLLAGMYFGQKIAKKSNPPCGFAPRYWPLLLPMVIILVFRIFTNAFGINEPSYYFDGIHAVLALTYLSFICLITRKFPREKKLTDTRWRSQTIAFILCLFAVLAWQGKQEYDNTLKIDSHGVTVFDESIEGGPMPPDEEAIVSAYWPWIHSDRLAKLDSPATLLIRSNYPMIDGSTAFVPIYSAVVNEIYGVDDKETLQKYIICSKTSGAYDRLIRGDVDIIFSFQPSDGHLLAASKAGVELRLTQIASEAFVFFVNSGNPVTDLSIEQIQDIYQKKNTNWKQVGGNDKKILPFQRPENSGSQTAMLKQVMKEKKLPPPLRGEFSTTMGGLYHDVAIYRDQEESIGYSFRFFTQEMVHYELSPGLNVRPSSAGESPTEPVKLLSVNGVAPTAENIRNGSYPLIYGVFVVTAGTSNPNVGEIIDWLLSPQGQKLIEKSGYVGGM